MTSEAEPPVSDDPESYLRAEEHAHRLVDELERLRDEVTAYDQAHQALGAAAGSLSQLSVGTSELIAQMQSLGPELLAEQQALDGRVGELESAIARLEVAVRELVNETRANTEEARRLGQEQAQQVARELALLKERSDKHERALRESGEAMRTQTGAIENGFLGLRGTVWVVGLVLVVALLAVVALELIRG